MIVSRILRAMKQAVVIGMIVLFSDAALTAAKSGVTGGGKAPAPSSSGSWKYDGDILLSTQYRSGVPQCRDALYCDKNDHLWVRVALSWLDEHKKTDAYWPRVAEYIMVSKDKGMTWAFTDEPWPGPCNTRSTLPDGTIIETGSHCYTAEDQYERYPRWQIESLTKE